MLQLVHTNQDPSGFYNPQYSGADPGNSGWMAYYVPAANAADTLSVEESLASVKGYYLFAQAEPDSLTDFLAALGNASLGSGSKFVWVQSWNASTKVLQAVSIALKAASGQQEVAERVSFQFRPSFLTVAAGSVVTAQDSDTPQMLFANPTGGIGSLLDPTGSGGSIIALDNDLHIPLYGPARGTLQAGVGFDQNDLNNFKVALTYFIDDPDGEEGDIAPLRFPVYNMADRSDAYPFVMSFDPSNLLNGDRTNFSFNGNGTSIGSWYRTNLGHDVRLLPQPGARIVLQFLPQYLGQPVNPFAPTAVMYPVPDGDYELAMDPEAVKNAPAAQEWNRLMCGLAGTEYITFQAEGGAILSFYPGQPAYAPPKGNCDTNNTSTVLTDGATSAYAAVGPKTAEAAEGPNCTEPAEIAYYAQPPQSSMFTDGGVFSVADYLNFVEVEIGKLPLSGGSGKGYPMVPFAGIDPAVDLFAPDDYRSIESRAIAPGRRNAITLETPGRSGGNEVTTVTPQGLVAELDLCTGVWENLLLAQNEDEGGASVQLKITGITNNFRNALQRDKLFLVASTPNSMGNFNPNGTDGDNSQIPITGWNFNLAFTDDVNTTPILLFKFYDGESVEELLKCPAVWALPNDFNSDISTISRRIQAAIAEAVANKNDPRFARFLNAVTNPNWSGILSLGAAVPPSALPTEVRGLTAGMDLSQFKAHHFGVEINRIEGHPVGIARSSLFALIDYNVPKTNFAASCYDFWVPVLKVSFANSTITDFQCTLQVAMNTFFQENVTLQNPQDPALKNVITFSGGYEDHNGQSIYTFVTTDIFNFQADDANAVFQTLEVLQLEFTTVNTDPAVAANDTDPMTIYSRFTIYGAMGFKTIQSSPFLDLFSFNRLTLSGLGVMMQNTINDPNNTAVDFGFDPRSVVFNPLADTTEMRANSMLKNFPLKLSNLEITPNQDNYFNRVMNCPNNPDISFSPTEMQFFDVDISPSDALNSSPSGYNKDLEPTYALALSLDMGTLGDLISLGSGLSATVWLGWKGEEYAMWLKLPQAFAGKLQFGLQGVLDVGFGGFRLEFFQDENNNIVFALIMGDFFFKVFGLSIDASISMDLMLFAGPNDVTAGTGGESALAWYFGFSNSAVDTKKPKKNDDKQNGAKSGSGTNNSGSSKGSSDNGENGNNDDKKDDPTFLQVSYLGLGQRVGPPADVASGLVTVADVLKYLTDGKLPNSDQSREDLIKALAQFYQPDRGWLIGAQFTLYETLTLGGIFNDPVLYGLLIKISSEGAWNGFQIQILYKKITDNIGVYSLAVTLPDFLRKLDFGEVTVYLPSIGVQVFTNGNFKVDVGFPKSPTDFSNSFAVEVLPFKGAGGFFFGYLNGDTSTLLPNPQQGQELDPVLEFGLALSIGLGKEIKSGPFKASFLVAVNGILQGAVGWFASRSTSGGIPIQNSPDAWLVQGQLLIVGKISGSVDFGIIKASVELEVSAGIGVRYQNDMPLKLWIEASVSVKVKVVIGSFKIFGHKIEISVTFKFKMTVKEEWTIGSGSSAQAAVGYGTSVLALAAADPECATYIKWVPSALFGGTSVPQPINLPVYFAPQNTVVTSDNGNQAQSVITLVLQRSGGDNGTDADARWYDIPFDAVAAAMLAWSVKQYFQPPIAPTQNVDNLLDYVLTQDDLSTLGEILSCPVSLASSDGNDTPLNYANITQFLKANFNVTVGLPDESNGNFDGTIFPVIPELWVTVCNSKNDVNYSFNDTQFKRSQEYVDELARYFAILLTISTPEQQAAAQAADADEGTALAQIMFEDYFALLVKSAVNLAWQYMIDEQQSQTTLGTLLDNLQSSNQYGSMASQASRFLQYGLRIPSGDTIPPDESQWPTLETGALYALTGQMFPVEPLSMPDCSDGVAAAGADDKPYTITLHTQSDDDVCTTPPGAQTADWFTVEAGTMVTIDSAGLCNLQALEDVTITASGVTTAPGAVSQPHTTTFALQTYIGWTNGNGSGSTAKQTLFPFPSSLTTALIENCRITLDLLEGTAGNAFHSDGGSPTEQTYTWASSIAITVQKVPVAQGGGSGYLENIYQLGGADEANRAIIEMILFDNPADCYTNNPPAKPAITNISLLYTGSGGQASGKVQNSDVLLVKTNLSTESNPTQAVAFAAAAEPTNRFSATLDDTAGFLTLIDELSIVNSGGYFLYYADESGQGFPDDIFQTGNIAQLTVLVEFAAGSATPDVPAWNFMNTVIVQEDVTQSSKVQSTDGNSGPLFYAEAPEMINYQPLLNPGTLAFTVTRDNPNKDRPADGDCITCDANNLYNLLEYYISADNNPDFNPSPRGLPVGPTDPTDNANDGNNSTASAPEDDVLPWVYQQTISLVDFAKNPVQPLCSGLSAAGTNPYVGIGGTVNLDYDFLDIFGNRMTPSGKFGSADFDIRYTDELIAIAAWPGVTTDYEIQKTSSAGTGNLVMTLCFDPSSFTSSDGSSDTQRILEALGTYAKIYHQLSDPNTGIGFATDLAPELGLSAAQEEAFRGNLCTFVTNVYNTLAQGNLPSDGSNCAVTQSLSVPIAQADRDKQTQDIYEVSVSLTFTRPQNLVNSTLVAQNASSVWNAPTVIPPITRDVDNGDSGSSGDGTSLGAALEYFATGFQAAFTELKAATGIDDDNVEGLWAVRLAGSGIQVQIEQDPIYYAPAPLSNSLYGDTVQITQYNDKAEPTGTIAETVSGVDLDQIAMSFTQTMDAILGPDNAVYARQLSLADFNSLADSKESIAKAISEGVTYLLQRDEERATGENLAQAQETLEQRMLITLSSAYSVNAVVQFPVTVTSPYEGDNAPQFYGKVQRKSTDGSDNTTSDKNNSISTARIRLAGDTAADTSSRLTFLYSTKQIVEQTAVNLDMEYALSHLEHNIGAEEGPGDGYQTSNWLTFILPPDPSELGAQSIPLALREYPASPTLQAQSACAGSFGGDSGKSGLEAARLWYYSFTYERPNIAQDTIFTDVRYNVPPGDVVSAQAAEDPPLSHWLVRFAREYPILAPYLAQLKGAAAGSPPANALDAFSRIVAGAARTWSAWVTNKMGFSNIALNTGLGSAGQGTDTFKVSNPNSQSGSIDICQVSSFTGRWPYLIVPNASGVQTLLKSADAGMLRDCAAQNQAEIPCRSYGPEGSPVSADTCMSATNSSDGSSTNNLQRTLIVDNLDVLELENAWGGVRLMRNLELVNDSSGQPLCTNPEFVYSTPRVSFIDVATPLIDSELCIDIAAVETGSPVCRSLSNQMLGLFNQLFGDTPDGVSIMLSSFYSFDVYSDTQGGSLCDDKNLISSLPVFLRTPFALTDNQTLANNISQVLSGWFAAVDPSQTNAFLLFDLSVFSTISDSNLPILRLRNLRLSLSNLNDSFIDKPCS